MQAIAETLMLRDHGGHLPEYVVHLLPYRVQRVFMAQHDRGQDAHIVTHLRLIGYDAVKLFGNEFEGYGLSHIRKVISRGWRVNRYAVS